MKNSEGMEQRLTFITLRVAWFFVGGSPWKFNGSWTWCWI